MRFLYLPQVRSKLYIVGTLSWGPYLLYLLPIYKQPYARHHWQENSCLLMLCRTPWRFRTTAYVSSSEARHSQRPKKRVRHQLSQQFSSDSGTRVTNTASNAPGHPPQCWSNSPAASGGSALRPQQPPSRSAEVNHGQFLRRQGMVKIYLQ
jgi:hypothetical protein